MYIRFVCPGGIIALFTSQNEVVTNGWFSRRDYPTSNSGIVVELKKSDFENYSKYVLTGE